MYIGLESFYESQKSDWVLLMRFFWRFKRIKKQLLRRILMVSATSACKNITKLPFTDGNTKKNGLKGKSLLLDAIWAEKDPGYWENPFIGYGRGWYYDTRRRILINRRGCVIRDSVNTSTIPWVPRIKGYRYSPDTAEVKTDGPAMVLRTQCSNFYHTLVDNLPRLFTLGTSLEGSNETVEVLVPEKLNAAEKYWIPKMLPAKAHLHLIRGDTPVVWIDKVVYVSPLTRRFNSSLPAEYISYFRNLAYSSEDRPPEKRRLIIIRPPSAKGGRNIINRQELITALQPYGFKPVLLEDYTIEDQVKLFRSAEVVIGAHGAGLTNMLFIEGYASVIELFPGPYIIPHYFHIAHSLKLNYYYCFSDQKGRNDDFIVDIPRVLYMVDKALAS